MPNDQRMSDSDLLGWTLQVAPLAQQTPPCEETVLAAQRKSLPMPAEHSPSTAKNPSMRMHHHRASLYTEAACFPKAKSATPSSYRQAAQRKQLAVDDSSSKVAGRKQTSRGTTNWQQGS
eukprot:CAMPEP_0178455218 /NCGR_PEP_ID=MMETSP0689_2-20121128/45787_1 /TAXON_ID=160604 /ORGANISM="Amphidinium massartii, Strain CS-259" /LENGTH=119 /DNA_ID=CAMNT_0020081229 /DNA_START=571 /DNA_END=931 /DNA_ORIENTATION=+